MRSISELDLATIIPLLVAEIAELEMELQANQDLECRTEIQEQMHRHEVTLSNLMDEYKAGWSDSSNLPPLAQLVRRPRPRRS